MAEVTRVHGDTSATTVVGRDLEFALVNVTGDITVAGVLDQVRKVIDTYSSITIVGTPTATDVIFGIEGADVLDVEGDQTYAEVEAAIDAIAGLSSADVSIVALNGAVLS